jgi:non-specific serine/threonine protein kinase
MARTIGEKIDQYEIREKIGEGGMGEVFLATDTRLGRDVALKFIPESVCCDDEARERLLREAQAASRLSHPNIMTVHDIHLKPGCDFIVMEYVKGLPLNEFCRQHDSGASDVLEVAIQVLEGVNKAHGGGVIHRDLKPANVLVNEDGQAKILDFGLAKIEDAAKLTKTGSTIGTMAYFSPEQAQGQTVDRRSDLFSYGVMLYELLAGRLPFDGEHQAAVVYGIVHENPPPLARFNSDVPDELQRIVTKCLAKTPEERYQSAADLLADIKACRRSLDRPGGREARVTREDRRPILAILPFANLGPAEDEYFADGMTEEIISRMAGVKGLGVISRTSAMRYKQTDKSMGQIGSELGAEFILEGTVRWGRSKDGPARVRITPQLIRVSDDTHLWSDRYDRTLEDVFDVQSDIAECVFDQLNVTLLAPEKEGISAHPTEIVQAYNVYLEGLAYSRRPGYAEENFHLALAKFEEATKLDPEFALAYAQQSMMHSSLFLHGFEWTTQRAAQAKEAVDRALQLQPELPKARMALGLYHYRCHLDYASAERELDWAFRRAPEDEDIRLDLAAVKRRQGDFGECLRLTQESFALNPRDAGIAMEIGVTLVMMRHFQEGDRYLDLSLSIDPYQPIVFQFRALMHLMTSGDVARVRDELDKVHPPDRGPWVYRFYMVEMYDRNYPAALKAIDAMGDDLYYEQAWARSRALLAGLIHRYAGDAEASRTNLAVAQQQFEKACAENPDDARLASGLGLVYAGLGLKDKAIELGKKGVELYPISRDRLFAPFRELDLAEIHALVGELDASLDLIDTVLSRPVMHSIHHVRLNPAYDGLRDHPRYRALLEKDYPPF